MPLQKVVFPVPLAPVTQIVLLIGLGPPIRSQAHDVTLNVTWMVFSANDVDVQVIH